MGLIQSTPKEPVIKREKKEPIQKQTNTLPTYKYVNIKHQYKNRHIFKTAETISISNGKDLSIEHLSMTGEDAII